MITAVEEHRLQQRGRNRSGAAGPEFSVPSMSAVADMLSMTPLPTAPSCLPFAEAPATATPSIDFSSYLGRSVGTGQCVALVRAAQPGLGPSSTWNAGAPIQGNTALSAGTPIATFDAADRYANALDGSSHAALYLSQDAKGITVLDQWAGSAAAIRTIPWTNKTGLPANTASAFRVVKT